MKIKKNNEETKRVLHIVGQMNMGGQETFIMNLYRNIDRKKIQFDFIVHSKNRGYYDDEIEKLGGKIHRITSLSRNPIKHCIELKNVLKNNKYIAVHRHTCSSIIAIDLIIAKICGVKQRIVHSHANRTNRLPVAHIMFRPLMNMFANEKLACSKDAGVFLYGKKGSKELKVINNAIEIEKYKYNENMRNEIRKKYNSQDNLVLGHVGRFDEAKNHKFIIEVFRDLVKKMPNAKLWLVGGGELEEEVKNQVKSYNLEEKIVFLGIRNDIEVLMMGMDVFVFPSIYEGLGIALIEAQCSGLKCMVSNNIQDEAIITNNVLKMQIDSTEEWVENICKIHEYNRYIEYDEKIEKFGMDNLVKTIYKLYLNE